ncbi:hypothetical protein O181_065124 [Austropuccinia psidii MF-1]|uniref:Alpha/beta hydrolase fold-3 domain-containing protein n=1 Tax=Austropuccinia psidii MF-1 TaxID=1389203 RepID=A0A9Q3EQV6_9BASI|nr:hypothetical protein [Austropuccinia psidii MF-1]
MIDHLLGRPSLSWKRTHVILVLLFWYWRLKSGDSRGPVGIKFFNDKFKKFTPWQIVVSLLTCLYGLRHWDVLLGLGAPEPLARLYSRGFYRATWINTALDAGFATASPIPFKWLRDFLSIIFSAYYIIYANEADEKLRRFRAIPTVEVLRITWEKTTNPIIRFFTRHHRPSIPIKRKYTFPRPIGSKYTKPITCWLYFSSSDLDLVRSKNLIIDVPGGGFIAMSPPHHEERLLRWAIKTQIPILAIDYCKAPEYPFPYAIHECLDVYRLIQESKGRIIGMGRDKVDVVLTGDSAGANLSAAMVVSIIESEPNSPLNSLPLPVGILWMYPALDFNFTSWMSPENLRILRQDQSSATLPEGILEAKNHLDHKSPLSVVNDRNHWKNNQNKGHRRKASRLSQSFANLPNMMANWKRALTPRVEKHQSEVELKLDDSQLDDGLEHNNDNHENDDDDDDDDDKSTDIVPPTMEKEKSLVERVLYHEEESAQIRNSFDNNSQELTSTHEQAIKSTHSKTRSEKKSFGTHLTMTSRTGFFNDRIISPSMMRCMAICYIGPRNAPDLTKDYHISPIFTPPHILADFPPIYLVCGEKDPFVDDTVLLAGKLREAKQKRKKEALSTINLLHQSSTFTQSSSPDSILKEDETDWVQMRIFEGWSHGFAQMLPLLPQVGTALDLMADFILSAFQKHDAKSSLSSNFQRRSLNSLEKLNPTGSSNQDEALVFTPRFRFRADSSSPNGSPPPPIHNLKSFKHHGDLLTTPSRDSQLTSYPISPRSQLPTNLNSLPKTTNLSAQTPDIMLSATPNTILEFNVATAAAIVTPPIIPTSISDALPTRKEGKILDNHLDLLHRRREEAGYGLPPLKTPEEHIKPLELSTTIEPKVMEDELKGRYVQEKDLLARRRLDSVYGITPNSAKSNTTDSNFIKHE